MLHGLTIAGETVDGQTFADKTVELTVNGQTGERSVAPDRHAAQHLRHASGTRPLVRLAAGTISLLHLAAIGPGQFCDV